MVKEVNVGLIQHRVPKVLLNRTLNLRGLQDGLSVSENVIGVLVGHLAVAHEGSRVVLEDQGAVFLNHCALAIGLRFIPHHRGFKFKKLLAVGAHVCAIVFDLTHLILLGAA
ncbi:MAG: hypothetical protein EBT56_15675 [Betaproteobacteria bacterium]|nr:hypothetical protein [Betaproteobacteria bacterium]